MFHTGLFTRGLIGVAVVALISCNGYSGKGGGDGRKGASKKECTDRAPREDGRSESGKDPWGDDLNLVQDQVLFSDVKDFLTEKCVSCHEGYDEADTAKEKADTYIERMDLEKSATGFMPKGGDEVSLQERAKFIAWKYSGFPETAGDLGKSGGSDTLDTGDTDGWSGSRKGDDLEDDDC